MRPLPAGVFAGFHSPVTGLRSKRNTLPAASNPPAVTSLHAPTAMIFPDRETLSPNRSSPSASGLGI